MNLITSISWTTRRVLKTGTDRKSQHSPSHSSNTFRRRSRSPTSCSFAKRISLAIVAAAIGCVRDIGPPLCYCRILHSAGRKKATPAQITLAWLLAQKPWIIPIPGTTKLARLEENIGAVAVELTSDDLREIESAASRIAIEGARYPEALESRTGL
jgi:Aldo/keto reductase family